MPDHKRGYSREFPTDQSRRIKREIDWVPPALDRSLRAKLKREGVSLRALTLRLWTEWLERDDEAQDSAISTTERPLQTKGKKPLP